MLAEDEMAVPLLKTKLYIPPARPGLVSRPRLVERLDEGLRTGRKLTLISAPAGFGKTTLLNEWIHSRMGSKKLHSTASMEVRAGDRLAGKGEGRGQGQGGQGDGDDQVPLLHDDLLYVHAASAASFSGSRGSRFRTRACR